MNADVIVIGGGVIGSSITYHLARDGVKVKQLEKGSIANQGAASRASAGGIRLNNRDPRELDLAKASIKRWESLEEELEANLEYGSAGQIMLFDDRYMMDEVEKQVIDDLKNGIEAKIVIGSELNELVPSLSPTITKAIHYPSGGQANGLLTTVAYTSKARRLGAEIITGIEVYSIVKENNRVVGVETSNGFIHANTVINAAGAWTPALHETLGLSLPQIKHSIRQMSATYPAPLSTLPGPTIGAKGTKISLKQTIDGRIRAGGGYITKPGPDKYTGIFNEEELEEQRNTVLSLLPAVEAYEIDFTYYGAEAYCIDNIPILGPIPEVEGYLIAAGFSGHGFTLSPAIGMVMAEVAQGKQPSISIEAFKIDRSYNKPVEGETSAIHNLPG
ncbi:NAD(P)/FAD-dependent oxidoreductase [Ornithinibacillus sp. 4-3]|uniref:NAD(P)/FAD-dependent oxidoreductase n=1 Tax=Ornithinibacillus sp. 4-3 TaxID=3231488 RepID=A0AB39HU52_9BACI